MAYVKFATLAVFLLSTLLMFPVNNACSGVCSPFEFPHPCGDEECRCIPWGLFIGQCIDPIGFENVMKKVKEHPNLCQHHDDCTIKGSGSFCGHYLNAEIEYGWCFASETEAQHFFNVASSSAVQGFFKNIVSNTKPNGLLKVAMGMDSV